MDLVHVDKENDDIDEVKLWLSATSSNPSFDFLKDKKKDIYALTDGEPFSD